MSPSQHLEWFQDNSTWFCDLSPGALEVTVPACPEWTVENVVSHLAFGLGLGYPYALRAGPDCPDDQAFADVPWPTEIPVGVGALDAFRVEIGRCIDTFHATSPSQPCSTYAGPGVAAFWFRRAAIETTLHRMSTDAVVKLEDERWAALIGNDLDRLDELIHPALTYTHSNAIVDTKDSYIASIRDGVVSYLAVEREDRAASESGNTVVLTGKATFSVRFAGNDITIVARYTAVWVNDDGNWQFFAWQNTPILS